MASRAYQVGRSTITVRLGDITASPAEVLVSSDDALLSMGGGVSQAILRAGGLVISEDAVKHALVRAGDVVVTTAGRLPARYLFHAITIGPDADLEGPTHEAIVRQTCRKSMQLLTTLGCRSIAFPAIGTGFAGIPYEVAASQMAATLVRTLLDSDEPYTVELYLHRPNHTVSLEDFFVFFEQFAARTMALESVLSGSSVVLEPPTDAKRADSEEERDAQRRAQVFEMLRHLDARRTSVETALLDALTTEAPEVGVTLGHLRAQLAEIEELRRGYEAELAPSAARSSPPIPNSVFLSSTYVDLRPHRQALRDVIDRLHFAFIGMEEFPPSGETPGAYIRKKVCQADVYIGVIGRRYGYVDPTSGLSMTELEYRQAVVSKKDILMFVMSGEAMITADMVERSPEALARLNEFTGRVLKSNVCGMFRDLPDLVAKAEHALGALRPG